MNREKEIGREQLAFLIPSQEEIARRCFRIQTSWTEMERAKRRLQGMGVDTETEWEELLPWFEFEPDVPSLQSQQHYII